MPYKLMPLQHMHAVCLTKRHNVNYPFTITDGQSKSRLNKESIANSRAY